MGGKKQTTTETRNPYAPSEPLYRQSSDAIGRYLADPNSTSVYDGPRSVGMSDMTRGGQEALAGNRGYEQSRDYMSRTLNGDYLNNNPELANLQQAVRSSVMPGLNATFAKSGMMGSTLHQGTLGRALTDGMAAPMFQNYQNERGYQNQAASLLPQMDQANAENRIRAGQLGEGYDRERIAADMAAFNERRDAPIGAVQRTMGLTQAIGGAGGTSTSTTTQKANPWEVGAGIGMMGLSAMAGMPGMGMGFGGLGAGLGRQIYSAPGTAANGGWSTAAYKAPWTF